ncbi:MAG: glycoside hydrolase family 2 [Tyzzerella sp.]|nr:glycoside hydrolase family 2 [Tyzzerella sp.]
MIQLTSRWGKQVDVKNPLPEYPRPNMVRDSYSNLNGEWEYCINQQAEAVEYDGKILVPFSPETALSGVQKIVMPEDYLHYRKVFTLPEGFIKDRVLLHFGAVDQECTVSLNGQVLGEHVGGYLAFHFDVTEHLVEGENVLTLCVKDRTEKAPHARGKQKLVRKGGMSSLFYTPQSGIWKTVWMESVADENVESLKITPMFDEAAVKVEVRAHMMSGEKKVDEIASGKEATSGESRIPDRAIRDTCESRQMQITVMDGEKVAAKVTTEITTNSAANLSKIGLGEVIIPLGEFTPWTPENPHLYDLKITYGQDEVTSYFGMRKFSVGKDKNGILRFFMNNKPFFFNGVLDQGYWPESLMTPPTEEALKYDIVKLKELGYNTIRKHIKIEPDRFYYLCDKLGMIVWQDMPNGGGDYNLLHVMYLTNVFSWYGRAIKDNHYGMFARKDEAGRKQYYEDLKGMVEQLYNYPSIAVWVPFNEGWGQFDATKATELIRSLDETRLVNEACGWFDQKGGDMYSIHNYLRKLKVKPKKDRVVALTEFGGYAFPIPGHMACEKEFGYKHYKTKEELTANYRRLWEEEIYLNLERGLSSSIYTQTSDIEEEINGLMTYDREESKFVEEELKALHAKLYEKFEKSS